MHGFAEWFTFSGIAESSPSTPRSAGRIKSNKLVPPRTERSESSYTEIHRVETSFFCGERDRPPVHPPFRRHNQTFLTRFIKINYPILPRTPSGTIVNDRDRRPFGTCTVKPHDSAGIIVSPDIPWSVPNDALRGRWTAACSTIRRRPVLSPTLISSVRHRKRIDHSVRTMYPSSSFRHLTPGSAVKRYNSYPIDFNLTFVFLCPP